MKREKIMKIVAILIPLIFVASIFLFLSISDNRENLSDYEPILVSHTRKIPKIDGVVESGEWNDVIFYTYHSEGENSYKLPLEICMMPHNCNSRELPTDMKLAMKDDGHWLYILVIVNDDKEDENDSIAIYTEEQHIFSVLPDWGLFFFHNGTALKCGISPPPQRNTTTVVKRYKPITNCSKPVNATFSSRYSDGLYTFEIKLSMNYLDLNKTNGYAPFVLVYCDSDKNSNSITTFSGSYCLAPGIKLIGELSEENKYYVEIGDAPPDYLAWFIVSEEAIIIVFLSALLFKSRKKKGD